MVNQIKHDREVVIQKATNLFWEKGFHATSMRNLQDHIDMRPGSIYAAFGSKEGLFKEALKCYTDANIRHMQKCQEQTSSPLEALKLFIRSIVKRQQDDAPSEVCMLVKTVSELTEDNAELLAESKRLLNMMEDGLEAVIICAQDAGEISSSSDTRRLAQFLQIQLIGLRAYIRTNKDNPCIDQLIEDTFLRLH
ncbi:MULTISPECIES: TetR/AcrR family transcriptional regulator [unclassified Neptuniibacter]|uniref:TetR/AcrR family transcriptional regulator n=1 Tax=unclassified Neptuniibacter TaxID=2630693 RepID=UPI0026E25F94|nr:MULTISPECIES: TetR/AcrR family transcriptional regulator [unclassified Neptuniibacter]MDO6513082.1 TetR/AcrR family transcriptional regulator [Neptuniibacter sp. 2_MG-2023]MDO6592506.1 TetR/AcrR family transcriptional regulator [Neptuniibacter sp. 1_MG-2023]